MVKYWIIKQWLLVIMFISKYMHAHACAHTQTKHTGYTIDTFVISCFTYKHNLGEFHILKEIYYVMHLVVV